jgi:hypothetical protein
VLGFCYRLANRKCGGYTQGDFRALWALTPSQVRSEAVSGALTLSLAARTNDANSTAELGTERPVRAVVVAQAEDVGAHPRHGEEERVAG